MNSFKFLGEGMAAEIERQIELLEGGGVVRHETLHYDPADRSLHARRSKEEADDYRYFPEPDLVPLGLTAELIDEQRGACPSCQRLARPASSSSSGCRGRTPWISTPRPRSPTTSSRLSRRGGPQSRVRLGAQSAPVGDSNCRPAGRSACSS